MRAEAKILSILCLLFLAGTVAAVGIPDTLTVTTDKPWIIANTVDQSTITVKVTNTTSPYDGDVQGVTVNLEVDPLYGTLNPTQVTTNLSGMASSTFKVKTKSGAAQINATIPATIPGSTIQNIDHNSAYFADFNHPINGTVASEVPFTVSLTDQYRNPVDNRRGNHIVNLHVHGPFPDDCSFNESSYTHDITRILDANGNMSVNVKLTSKIGDNNIAMDAYQSIPNQLEWISAEAKGKPFSITQVYSPSGSPPTLPADGVKYFTILYNLYDEYGNPTNKQFIWVNTSVLGEEQKQYLSNNMGQVTVQYGPRSSIGEIDITATSVANSTLTLTQRVKFKNTAAEIISLTANPDTMPSQDVNPSFLSDVIATVADQSGNAVAGETVTFAIENITYEGMYNVTADPNLLNSSAITDEYGRAAVQFRPGSFTTVGNPGYNATATGNCILNATWKNTNKTVTATWKNYPYLSVSTKVTPLTVEINKTIDVTIEFRGDGWALQPRPIDVLLLLDNSGSMGSTSDNNSGVSQSKRAAISFINQMAPGKDRVGVIFYDKNTYPNFSVYVPLTYDLDSVKNSISGYTRTNTNGYHTRTRYALYEGITLMNDWNNRMAVRTIIHMTDGQWSMEGDPLARAGAIGFNQSFSPREDVANGLHSVWAGNVVGVTNKYRYFDDLGGGNGVKGYRTDFPNGQTFNNPLGTIGWASQPESYETTQNTTAKTSWYFTNAENSKQNMAVYANESGLVVYSIGFTPSANLPNIQFVLQTMSDATGGFYKYAPTETDLANVYKEIAEELKDTAGVNATMTADFDKVNVTGFAMEGDQVYDYVYHPMDSTKIRWQDGITNVTNQSDDWRADSKLDFNIGTIKVGQYWNATFRLKVNQSGLIDVFGKNSTVSFNGGNEKLYLPQTFITVVPNLSVTEIAVKTITLEYLTCTETGEIKALIPVKWNTNYTGNKTLTENVYYRIDDKGPWVQFDIKTHLYDPLTMEYVDYAQLDVTKLPPGSYQIMVYATASDAPDATKMLSGPVIVGNRGKTFIKLQ
jgi:hypothetical protein